MMFMLESVTMDVSTIPGAKWLRQGRWRHKDAYAINIESVDDLLRLADIDPEGIIISKTFSAEPNDPKYTITIYDGYIE